MSYKLPETLANEISEFETVIAQYLKGELDAASLRSRRVPFGCYEQRRDGTYMVRIRTTGGALTPAQLLAIASLSEKYGAEAFHITTRQEFQIHDLALESVIPIMRSLHAVGLSTRGGGGNTVRNIIVSPDAGVAPDEVFDPSPYAFALTSRLIAEPDSWVLPRKLKIAFSNSARDTAFAQFNDLGFVATIQQGARGFKVYVAGGMGSKPEVAHQLHDFIPTTDVYLVAEAIKHLFDKHGNRKNKFAARLRYLWNAVGETRFRELYEQELEALRQQNPPPLTPSRLPEQVGVSGLIPAEDTSPEFQVWKHRYCHAQSQEGLSSVLIPVFLGNIQTREAVALATFLRPFGDDVLRATFGQNLRLRNIPEAYLGNVYAVAKDISTLASAPSLLANSIACTGADTCRLGVCLPKGALRSITRKLTRSGINLEPLADFRLNLSGCPNTCGQHMTADLGFYGRVGRQGQRMYPEYGVVAGAVVGNERARLAQPVGRVSARDLPSFVSDVLKTWVEKKPRFASFADYFGAEGREDLHRAADRYRDVPDFDDDKNYYFDWGSSELFSLVGKGVGECSAGLFDLIGVDLKQISEEQQRLDLAADDGGEVLRRIVLLSSRMLLVTRGIEAATDDRVYASFSKHFINAGLVDERFRPVVEAARQRDLLALRLSSKEVLALAGAVKELYDSMDNSLRFSAEILKSKTQPPTSKASILAAERDYRGVACPMNFVKVKLDLARLHKGDRLKVLLDDGQPIENVPRSVAQEGHKVLEQQKLGKYWEVMIEKS